MKLKMLPQKHSSLSDIEALKTLFYSHLISIYGKNLSASYFFGSYAKGKQQEHSDLDILVILNNCNQRPLTRLKEFTEPDDYLGPPISPIVLSKKEFLSFKNPIILGLLDGMIVVNDCSTDKHKSLAHALFEKLKNYAKQNNIQKIPFKSGYYWKLK